MVAWFGFWRFDDKTDGKNRDTRGKTRMGKWRHRGACDHCGKQETRTRDHVIPQVLLPSYPGPSIVHVRSACNNELKPDDDALLKDVTSVDD